VRSRRFVAVAGCVAAASVGLVGLNAPSAGSTPGGGNRSRGVETSGYKSPLTESLSCVTRGGTLNVLQESGFEHLDPGVAYYALDYSVVYATQRPLYSYGPNTETEPTPDLAEGPPEISNGGRTLTVRIKSGIHFSPPVNREVTSADVAYAIERGGNPNVANPYFHSYFEAIEGAPQDETGGPLKGIETPNAHEIVFHLSEAKAAVVAKALVLPLSAPVPKEYAEKFDKNRPSDYEAYEVATGPYMLKNNAEGKVLGIGNVPGQSATLVRNPNWNASTDFRPACLSEIDIKIGGGDVTDSRLALEGEDVVESTPPARTTVREAAERYKGQLEISPGAGDHYIGVNNKVGPFRNIDLRKAFWAALDRRAMTQVRGGNIVSTVATHFLYPGIPGFDQAGGLKGPRFDFNEHPEGDMKVARKYMRLAGYRSGHYTGHATVKIVGARGAPAEQDAEVVNATLRELGFHTKMKLVEDAVMYVKYCNVPKQEVTICPSVGWIADFADGQAVLQLPFDGNYINQTANVNWSQVDIPRIDRAMAKAELLTGEPARAKAWAKIDIELVRNAVAVPFDWDKEPNIEGKAVNGVGDLWNEGGWDYSWTSLD
jgi:peptide/nickel transport system substrate-binding protein